MRSRIPIRLISSNISDPRRGAKHHKNIRDSASKTRPPEFFGIRMRDGGKAL